MGFLICVRFMSDQLYHQHRWYLMPRACNAEPWTKTNGLKAKSCSDPSITKGEETCVLSLNPCLWQNKEIHMSVYPFCNYTLLIMNYICYHVMWRIMTAMYINWIKSCLQKTKKQKLKVISTWEVCLNTIRMSWFDMYWYSVSIYDIYHNILGYIKKTIYTMCNKHSLFPPRRNFCLHVLAIFVDRNAHEMNVSDQTRL